jgi:DNA-binding NarL/FixJ family response regulator
MGALMLDNLVFFSQFSTRQHEVLLCVLAGDTNSEIAAFLELPESSVRRYVRQLKKIAGVQAREEVRARWADTAFSRAA